MHDYHLSMADHHRAQRRAASASGNRDACFLHSLATLAHLRAFRLADIGSPLYDTQADHSQRRTANADAVFLTNVKVNV